MAVRKSEWNEKQLEELLRKMPKIEDHRDPREIYQNISLKMNKRKQKSWVIPSIATAAAILLFVVLSPNLMSWNDRAEQSTDQNSSTEVADKMEMAKVEENKTAVVEDAEDQKESSQTENEESVSSLTVEDTYTALYKEDVNNENVLTFTIPDVQAQNVVPISIMAPKAEGIAKIDQLKETMANLREEEWGLSDYYPLNADLSLDEKANVLNVNVPSGHYYGDGSASENAFTSILKETAVNLGVKNVALFTDNNPGIEMGNRGTIKNLELTKDSNRGYYFYYPNESIKKPFLVPYQEPYSDIETALNAMKENIDTHSLQPSIPSDVNIDETLSSGEEVLILKLNENSNITDDPSMIYTIEAILLTAKDFNFDKVKIEFTKLEHVGKFAFNEELDVPVAPNKMALIQ